MGSDASKAPDWARVEELFPDLLALPMEQRAGFLDRACAGDTVLREELESLVAAATQTTLDAAPTLRGTPTADPGPPAPATPGQLGAWRLLRLLGRGGMGEVYLAERVGADFEQRGALKILRPDAAAHHQRFESERRILAQLEHPNIARLVDGGVTPEGLHYMVMEYVDGSSLLEYCAARKFGLAERIGMFEQVARAVAYAHVHLVVHRDLKSGNILVTADGTPKLLDFGIAKLLDPGSGSETTHSALFTPEHAAPEQLQGAPATTAVDIYALGVMLFELLTGTRPWSTNSSPLSRVVEKLLQDQPGQASQAAQRNASSPVAASRLRGDLDAIIAKCLRKIPHARYATVDALLDDLRRWHEHRPVGARGDARGYIVRRWLRRHRVPVGAAALVLVAVMGGAIVATWQARTALREARRAESTRAFLVELFEGADPDRTLGSTVTAKDLLDRGTQRLASGLATEPELRSEMLTLVGGLYADLGFYREARAVLETSRSLRADSAQNAGALARVLLLLGEYEQAELMARAALDLQRSQSPRRGAAIADRLADLAAILDTRAKFDEALGLYAEAIAIDRMLDRREPLAGHLSAYSLLLRNVNRYDESLSAAREALALRRMLHGPEHTSIATSLLHLAAVQAARGEHRAAEASLQECLALRRKLLGDVHPLVAAVYQEIAHVAQLDGRTEDSIAATGQAVAILRTSLGDDHPDTANSRNSLGVSLYFQGRFAEAAREFEQVLLVWRKTHGPHHPDVFAALNNLGASLTSANELEAAERVLRETLTLRRQALGEPHEDVAQSLNNLADLLVRKEAFAEAESTYRQAIAMWRETLGNDHPTLAFGLMNLGKLLLAQDRCDEAEAVLRESVRLREKSLDSRAALLASSRSYLGQCLVKMKGFEEAEELLAMSVPLLVEHWGGDKPFVQDAQRAWAQAQTGSRRPD